MDRAQPIPKPVCAAGRERRLKGRCGALFLLLMLPLWAALGGCVSESTVRDRERKAYFAGREAAMAQMEQQTQQQLAGPHVSVVGQVRNPILVWTQGLTLSRAIVQSAYYSPQDPSDIIVHRSGREIDFPPKRLLEGQDLPLEPGDIIEIRR